MHEEHMFNIALKLLLPLMPQYDTVDSDADVFEPFIKPFTFVDISSITKF